MLHTTTQKGSIMNYLMHVITLMYSIYDDLTDDEYMEFVTLITKTLDGYNDMTGLDILNSCEANYFEAINDCFHNYGKNN